MDKAADALQEIKPESSWFQTRPESDRYKTNFSIESIATGIDVDFKDDTAKTQGAFDYTMGFLTQRTHKEWEPTYTLPRPLNVFSIEEGAAITTRARAGVYADMSEDWTMGLEVDAYGLGGDAGVGDIWGVTPPYFSNPFVGTHKRCLAQYSLGSLSTLRHDHVCGRLHPAACRRLRPQR